MKKVHEEVTLLLGLWPERLIRKIVINMFIPALLCGVSMSAAAVINVRDYGAAGDGSTNDTTAINNAFAAARTSADAVYFPKGTYKVINSINAANLGPYGVNVFGDGRGVSKIIGVLTESYPIIDFSGSGRVHLHDIRITGDTVGIQSCGILFARAQGNMTGDMPYVENVWIDGTYALTGVAVASADLSTFIHCTLAGPSGIVFGQNDYLGVGSKFNSFATVTGNTLHTIIGSTITPSSRSGVIFNNGAAVAVRDTYFGLSLAATAGIELSGPGGKTIEATNIRIESNSCTNTTHAIWVKDSSNKGMITGDWSLHGSGPAIRIDTDKYASQWVVNAITSFSVSGGELFIGGGGGIRLCTIYNIGNWDAEIADNSWSNTVYHQNGTGWTFLGDWANEQYLERTISINNLRVGGPTNPMIKQWLMVSKNITPGTVPANSVVEATVNVPGAAVGDGVAAALNNASLENNLIPSLAWVSATDTVKIRFLNPTTSAITTTARAWRIEVWKH